MTDLNWDVKKSTQAGVNNRTDLAKLFADRNFKNGAEIGVAKGEYALVLCEMIPNLKYYGIDSWYVGDMKNHLHTGWYDQALGRLASYDATLINKLSMDAVHDFENGSLDFVYIDANHLFDFVVCDIIEWTKKVRKGGIVAGHDYHDVGGCGVVAAVDGYVHSHSYRLNLTTDASENISWWFDKRWNS